MNSAGLVAEDGSTGVARGSLRDPFMALGVYLCVIAFPLLYGPPTPAHMALSLGHVALAASAFALGRSAYRPGPVVLMLLLALLPLMYMEIAWLNQLLASGYHDELVQGWEAAVFGSPATDLAGALPHPVLSEALHASYLAFYPAIYVPPLLLWRSGRVEALRRAVLGVLVAAGLCYAVFVYFPVQGPRYFGPPAGIPSGPFRALTLMVLESGSSRGAAFPSSHMSITLCAALVQLRFQPVVGRVLVVVAAGMGVGAVYGGFHYAIDMTVGALAGVAAAWFALRGFDEASSLLTPGRNG